MTPDELRKERDASFARQERRAAVHTHRTRRRLGPRTDFRHSERYDAGGIDYVPPPDVTKAYAWRYR